MKEARYEAGNGQDPKKDLPTDRPTGISQSVRRSDDLYKADSPPLDPPPLTISHLPTVSDLVAEAPASVDATPWRNRFLETQASRELAALRWSVIRGDDSGVREWFRELQVTRAYDLYDKPCPPVPDPVEGL